MNPIDLIAQKRDGKTLTRDELQYLVKGYVEDKIPDYQMSAFLMAVFFSGLNENETAALTELMRDSGAILDLTSIAGFKADKHSTGGVGDKVSLVLAPLVASAGVTVPMISGRALGHTGGTLDKLEAIAGFRTNLSLDKLKTQLEKIGVAMVGQTESLCPADRKMYALRDATATVNCIPLITASILSKKLAEGIDALVLDVKAGSGAIFQEKDKAWELAQILVRTLKHFQLKTTAIISSMQQPLGNAIGNWLETREAIDTLQGRGPEDLLELSLVLGSQMLVHGEKVGSLSEGMSLLENKISSGEAFARFRQMVEMQQGDLSVIDNPKDYPAAKHQLAIKSRQNGYLAKINCREIGAISMSLGAGRDSVEDEIDYTSGIILKKKIADEVTKGETLAIAFSNEQKALSENETRLQAAFTISTDKSNPPPLIYGMIDETGEKKWQDEAKKFE